MRPFKTQLLKWVGNKQRFAHEIVALFPERFGTYFEPFLGSGAVLATLAPLRGVGSDSFLPLVGIWRALRLNPRELEQWYAQRWELARKLGKRDGYEAILASYNRQPNPADFVYLTRSCYGGVVRFRKDGYMSTPCGAHDPISPKSFSARIEEWRARVHGTEFVHAEYMEAMERAKAGDLIYCDPPYSFSQAILYGAQSFSLEHLFECISRCKARGVYVALSIDGTKKSGDMICNITIPKGLFAREFPVNIGRSMLRRFQMSGQTLEAEVVHDRLLLTY